MSMSGIEMDPEIAALFNGMKLNKTHQYAVMKIENKKKVLVHTKGPKGSGSNATSKEQMEKEFNAFVDEFCKEDQPAYVLFDFAYTHPNGQKIEKLAFIFWCPDTCGVSDKMIYASTKDTVQKAFGGIGKTFEVNSLPELNFEEITQVVEKK